MGEAENKFDTKAQINKAGSSTAETDIRKAVIETMSKEAHSENLMKDSNIQSRAPYARPGRK